MDRFLKEKIEDNRAESKDKRKKTIVLTVIASMLALTIIYMTIFPAITMTPKPLCLLAEHTHTAECYEQIPICGAENPGGHRHTADCYATATDLATGTDLATAADLASATDSGKLLICGLEESEPHIHTDDCYETRLACTLTEHIHEDECYEEKLDDGDVRRVYSDESLTVTVVLPEESGVSSDAELLVTPITQDSNREYFDALVDAAVQNMSVNNAISDILFYDIRFVLDGEEQEPSGGMTRVSISFTEPVFSPEDIEKASSLKVLHFDDKENNIEDVTDVVDVGENGLSAVEFSTDSFSIYAIVLEDTTITGNYYQRVSSVTDTSASYLIVSAQGNYALTYGATGYATKVELTPIKGNPEYFEVKNTAGTNAANITNMNWTFNTAVNSSGASILRVTGYSSYRLRLNNNTITVNSSSSNVATTAAYSATTGCWTFRYNTFYLYMASPGTFSRSETTSNAQYRNLTIYKLVNTTLTIPGDVIEDPTQGTGIANPVKPNYAPYITPSGSVTGTYAYDSRTVVNAVSDPSTSQIEAYYDNDSADDGKVTTDKSVIYGGDDYNAFTDYADGTFGVTLSALAQEFNVYVDVEEQTPVDVVFVLDLSGSMTESRVLSGEYRAEAMVEAVNLAMDDLFKANPHNRAAIVGYSSDNWDILPMGRYYVGAVNTVPNYAAGYEYLSYTANGKVMTTDSSLRDEATRALVPQFSIRGNYWCGTFTQGGLARGMNMFETVTDTTYTTPSGKVVKRTPVYIFLSDGDPTHCTSNYQDPLSGPFYGDGVAVNNNNGVDNNQGIQGYYTILTANYCKQMTSIHYAQPARFYTIGLGINTSGHADMSGVSATGDHYKRTVLDPSEENIAALYNTAAQNYELTAHQLRSLLNGSYTGNPYRTLGSTDYAEVLEAMGRPNNVIPVLSSPYTAYDYADDATFDDFTTGELDALYLRIISEICEVINYGYVLQERTSALMYDYIGEGMELKSDPVLRYNGVNYLSTSDTTSTSGGVTTTTYVYDYDFSEQHFVSEVDLSVITVSVITDAAGNQTVTFFIPDDAVPVYSPVYTQEFYYEELPARLIYQVGVKDSALARAADGDVFYTNRWQNGVEASAAMLPTSDNPYYANEAYTETVRVKSENSTATAANALSTELTSTGLTHSMGNNGKLTVSKPNTMTITVNKEWQEHDGTIITDAMMLGELPQITYKLYRSTQEGTVGTLFDTVTADGTSNWSHTWTGLPRYDENDDMYYYFVIEEAPDGFETEYVNNTGLSSDGVVKVINRETGIMVAARKLWTDSAGQVITGAQLDDMPAITARLYRATVANGTGTRVSTMTLNAANDWSYVWTRLPYRDSGGDVYYYYVIEDTVPGYTATYSADLDGRSGIVTITNTPNTAPQAGEGAITVNKLWNDYNGNPLRVTDNMPPVTINLYRRSGYLDQKTVTVTFGSTLTTQTVAIGGSVTFSVTARYSSSTVASRSFIQDNNGIRLNTTRSSSTLTGSYTVSNVTADTYVTLTSYQSNWLGGGSSPNNPSSTSVTVSNVSGGTGSMAWQPTPALVGTATLNSRSNWTHTWDSLPNSETIDGVTHYYYYYLVEPAVTGFDTTYSPNNVLTATANNHGIQDGTIEVTNTSNSLVTLLPDTGGIGTLLYVMTGCALMLTACGMLLYKSGFGRRYRRHLNR